MEVHCSPGRWGKTYTDAWTGQDGKVKRTEGGPERNGRAGTRRGLPGRVPGGTPGSRPGKRDTTRLQAKFQARGARA